VHDHGRRGYVGIQLRENFVLSVSRASLWKIQPVRQFRGLFVNLPDCYTIFMFEDLQRFSGVRGSDLRVFFYALHLFRGCHFVRNEGVH
jgi:hypothetical protein